MERASDAELVALLADRRSEALREICRRYEDAVIAVAHRVLRDPGLAGDVAQEVFLGLWRQPSRFEPTRGPLGAFLCLQARGRAIDVLRSSISRAKREARTAGSDAVEHDSAPWQAVWNAHVRSAVEALDAGQRRPIELAFFNGLSYREVAELLNVPEGTIKTRIRTGLHRLRVSLASELPGAPSPFDPIATARP